MDGIGRVASGTKTEQLQGSASMVGMHFCPPINEPRGQMKPTHPANLNGLNSELLRYKSSSKFEVASKSRCLLL